MKHTVLVVDDDQDVLHLLDTLLSRAGYGVVPAAGAVEALEHLETDELGAVVLDIMMPVRSGIEVLEHIRWNPRLAHLPVVVLSAAYLTEEERQFVSEFAVGFVDKTHIAEVLSHLKAIFNKGEAHP